MKTDNTHGLLADVVEGVRGSINDLTLDLVGPSTIIPQAASAGGDIDVLGHAESLAVVKSLDGSKEVRILLEELSELCEELSTVLGSLLPPWTVESLAGGRNGNVNILLGSLLDSADNLLSRRVNDIEGLAIDRLHPLIVDEANMLVSN